MVLHVLLAARPNQGVVVITDPVVHPCPRNNINPKQGLEGAKHVVQMIQRSDCRQTSNIRQHDGDLLRLAEHRTPRVEMAVSPGRHTSFDHSRGRARNIG